MLWFCNFYKIEIPSDTKYDTGINNEEFSVVVMTSSVTVEWASTPLATATTIYQQFGLQGKSWNDHFPHEQLYMGIT